MMKIAEILAEAPYIAMRQPGRFSLWIYPARILDSGLGICNNHTVSFCN